MPTAAAPAPADAARATARILLEIKAVGFRPDQPYMLTSGWASPVYIDCRRLISFPDARRKVIAMACALIERDLGFANLDAIAGGETAGIPYAAWIAEAKGLPMLYVRKKPKGFGRNAQIEGHLEEGQRVLLVEDLATDGASKVTFAQALRTAGARVADAFVVFFYGAFPGALETLGAAGLTLHYLATWRDVVAEAEAAGHLGPASVTAVRAFLDDPKAWSSAHGGRG